MNYITSCLDGLLEKTENMFVDEKLFFAPLNNLLLIISKAKDERIDTVKIYDVVIKYLNNNNYNRHFESDILMSIIKNYEPNTDTAKLLIVKLLNFSSEYKQYAYCIYSLAKRLKKENHKLETFTLNAFESRDFLGAEISYIYPLLQGVEQKRALTYSLAKIDNLYDYIHFINYNDINEYSVERFKYLMEQNKSELSLDRICYILAELRKTVVS